MSGPCVLHEPDGSFVLNGPGLTVVLRGLMLIFSYQVSFLSFDWLYHIFIFIFTGQTIQHAFYGGMLQNGNKPHDTQTDY